MAAKDNTTDKEKLTKKDKPADKDKPTKKTAAKSKLAAIGMAAAEAEAVPETRHYDKDLSIQELQDNLNFDELNIPGKLKSLLAAKDSDGVHVTVGIYEKLFFPDGVGNLRLKENTVGTHTVWINDKNTKVSFSQGN